MFFIGHVDCAERGLAFSVESTCSGLTFPVENWSKKVTKWLIVKNYRAWCFSTFKRFFNFGLFNVQNMYNKSDQVTFSAKISAKSHLVTFIVHVLNVKKPKIKKPLESCKTSWTVTFDDESLGHFFWSSLPGGFATAKDWLWKQSLQKQILFRHFLCGFKMMKKWDVASCVL